MNTIHQNADMADGPAAKAASPSLSQKNLQQLSAMNTARAARSMTANNGPHNRGGGGAYSKNTIAPRSG